MVVLTALAICASLVVMAATVGLVVCGGLRAWAYCAKQIDSVAYNKQMNQIDLEVERAKASKEVEEA